MRRGYLAPFNQINAGLRYNRRKYVNDNKKTII